MRGQRHAAALVWGWFDLLPALQQPTARQLHGVIMAAEPSLELSVRGGNLIYAVHGVHAMAVAPFHSHLHLQLFRGGALADRFPELEGSAKGLRQLRMRHGQQVDELLVDALVKALLAEVAAPTAAAAPGGAEGSAR